MSSSSASDDVRPGNHDPCARALVVGDGAFAMAMATALARRGTDVRVLAHTTKVRDEINTGENVTYLPGYALDKEHIRAYTSIEEACSPDVALVLLIIPTQFLRYVPHSIEYITQYLVPYPVALPHHLFIQKLVRFW